MSVFARPIIKNKTTGAYEYLLDRLLEIDSHERLTEDAEPKTLAKAAGAESDYEVLSMARIKASEKNRNHDIGKYYDAIQATVTENVSKQFWLRKKIRGIY